MSEVLIVLLSAVSLCLSVLLCAMNYWHERIIGHLKDVIHRLVESDDDADDDEV